MTYKIEYGVKVKGGEVLFIFDSLEYAEECIKHNESLKDCVIAKRLVEYGSWNEPYDEEEAK